MAGRDAEKETWGEVVGALGALLLSSGPDPAYFSPPHLACRALVAILGRALSVALSTAFVASGAMSVLLAMLVSVIRSDLLC